MPVAWHLLLPQALATELRRGGTNDSYRTGDSRRSIPQDVTDHQQYSFDNQIAAILAYAAKKASSLPTLIAMPERADLCSNGATACGNCSTTLWVV